MSSLTDRPPAPVSSDAEFEIAPRVLWGPIAVVAAALAWFFLFEHRFGPSRSMSAFEWLWSAWNEENDFEHGPLFPLIIGGLIVWRFKDLKRAATDGSMWGLLAAAAGVFFYLIACRTLQPRIALGGLPFLLWGASLYFWGWGVARMLLFPFFFFWLAIPLPSFQQATNQLQLFAVSMAHNGASLFGVQTIVNGTQISSAHGNWEPLEIAAGCSGIRSLMALLMISGAWAYAAHNLALWKRVTLFLAAFPLAILGNSLRVTSIFVIAEYGDEVWARSTWHDWSGLLLFYPFSLFLLLVLHSILEGGLPWKNRSRREVRRVIVSAGETETPVPES